MQVLQSHPHPHAHILLDSEYAPEPVKNKVTTAAKYTTVSSALIIPVCFAMIILAPIIIIIKIADAILVNIPTTKATPATNSPIAIIHAITADSPRVPKNPIIIGMLVSF